jgi:competence protein ComEC
LWKYFEMKLWKYIFGVLLLSLAAIALVVYELPDPNLHIIACDVGQGDAILVTYGTTQILTDGGPDKSVLSCLGRHLPFWDREIELVVSTHPDSDHVTGLVSVLQDYKVDKLLINPIDPGTSVFQSLKNTVGSRGVVVINPTPGMKLRAGLIYLDILEPSERLLSRLSLQGSGDSLSKYNISEETNLYSIVYLLSFKNFSGLFPGDTPSEISDELAAGWSMGSVDYIKVPHHASNNGLTENLLKATMPKVAVISLGKNSWGFPKAEILEMLEKYGVKVLRTDQKGDIEIVTDGDKAGYTTGLYFLLK